MTAHFIAVYETPADPPAFDRHYREVHVPLARKLPGLRRFGLSRDVSVVRGSPYHLIADLEWDTVEDLRAAFASPAGRATAADAARLAEMAAVRSMVFVSEEMRSARTRSSPPPGRPARGGRGGRLLRQGITSRIRGTGDSCPTTRPALTVGGVDTRETSRRGRCSCHFRGY